MGNKSVLASRVLSRRGGFLVGVWVAYLLSFFLLYRWMGSFATILAVIPVIASGWLLGFRAGALAGLAAFLLELFLLYEVRSPDLRVMLGVPGAPIAMVLLAIGAAVGRLRDVSDQLELQLAKRKRAEEALRRQNEYLSALHETTLGLMKRLELEDVLENIVTRAAQLLGTSHGYIYLAEPGETEITWKVGVGIFGVPPLDPIKPGDGLTGQVWQTGQPLIVGNYDTWPGRLPNAPLGEIRTVMGMPLKSGEQVVGVIVMAHVEPNLTFGGDDVELLSRFAQLALIALDNARLYQAEREQRELAETLREIGATLVSTLDVDTVLDRILEQVSHVVPNDAANVMLVKDDQAAVARWRGYERFGQAPAHVVFSIAATPYLKQMVETGEPVTIPDTRTDPNWIQRPQSEWVRSFASAPIRTRGRVVGFLNVDAATPGFFGPVHIERLRVFADQAAIALENARLYQSEHTGRQRLEMLHRIGQTINSTLDAGTILDRLTDEAMHATRATHGSAVVARPDLDCFERLSLRGYSPEMIEKARRQTLLLDRGVNGRAYQTRQMICVDDVQADPDYFPLIAETRSELVIPIIRGEKVLGNLDLQSPAVGAFRDVDLDFLQALTDQVAIALENARLYQAEREQFRRLQESQAQLLQSEKMAALGRLIGSISHEINNPLQAIQGSLTLIEEEVEGGLRPEKLKRYVGIAGQSSERIANIVRRVREFYRPASQSMRPTDVRAVLEAVLALADTQLRHGNVSVEQEQVGDLPLVQANADELQQVLLNLVLNAVDAMAAPAAGGTHGGTLRVRMGRDRMQTRDGPARPAVRVEVSDTGDGIPPEILPHIFEPFTTTHPDKTALGLSISYTIIEAHGGQMTVTSQMGEGTTFTILLPAEITNVE